MSRKRRDLRPDEAELWKQVAETAVPMHTVKRTATINQPPKKPTPEQREIQAFSVGQKVRRAPAHDLKPDLHDHFRREPIQMDRKSFTRMKRGKLSPDARIDLHGMTLSQAHPALTRFILSAYGSGARLVLVITGKGRVSEHDGPIPTPRGILRHQVPQWLRQGSLAQVVMQITPAHIKHGGEGAYYVYLRRQR
ncbi:Smr/MutS family protein [Cognatishimia sp. MH4019]|uniref:Smr/MutS family protein n=1 Tax=Cognatishimia sp. MH4019 TaxID=2854030 RepID=UPI001CD4BCF1|nr:Smr/MutS family protein [Cognatishimia sp. MH4019]